MRLTCYWLFELFTMSQWVKHVTTGSFYSAGLQANKISFTWWEVLLLLVLLLCHFGCCLVENAERECVCVYEEENVYERECVWDWERENVCEGERGQQIIFPFPISSETPFDENWKTFIYSKIASIILQEHFERIKKLFIEQQLST